MSDLKWTRRHELFIDFKIDSVDEISNFDKENHIVVLPKNTKMKEAVDLYSRNEHFYVEHLHWNTNGILDGFIDHKKNMYHEEYNTRKTV